MRAQMIGQHMMSNQDMLYAGVRYSGSNGLGTTPATPPVSSILHDDRCSGLPHDVITGVEADSLRGGETTRTVPDPSHVSVDGTSRAQDDDVRA
ncbi:hypothetical protein, variant, partial [Sphaeroforma arctica JP610]